MPHSKAFYFPAPNFRDTAMQSSPSVIEQKRKLFSLRHFVIKMVLEKKAEQPAHRYESAIPEG